MQPENDSQMPLEPSESHVDDPAVEPALSDRGPDSPSLTDPRPTAVPKEPAAEGTGLAAAEPGPRRLAYLVAFRYVFENPEWFVGIVLASLCFFIPVLGQVAIWGFFYEVVESLHRQPDSIYPKFDFKRFGQYCVRGVWPFVLMQAVQVTLQLILQLPIQFSFQGMIILLATNTQVGAIVLGIGAPLIILFLIVLGIAVSLLTAPMLLRAGLMQDIRQVFRLQWFKGYWKRVWVEEIMSALYLMIACAVLLPLGCLLFCVGFFAAWVVILVAGAHMKWQIYEIYLERGGEPIPLHPLPAEAPPVEIYGRA
jgi:hypothetical protein